MRFTTTLFLFFLIIACNQKTAEAPENVNTEDEKIILAIHENYVEGWKKMNEERVMALFEDNSRIQPNSLTPIEGKDKIREFWFPKDGSVTTINTFETEPLGIKVMDTLAITTHRSYLDWSYKKDTVTFGMVQKGISTTVYRKQPDKTWKIWRQMWTDIYGKQK